jgi:hypothetical protein
MQKSSAKQQLEPLLDRAEKAAEAIGVPGTAVGAEVQAVRAEIQKVLGGVSFWGIKDEVVEALDARCRSLADTATEVRKAVRERDSALATVDQLGVALGRCGAELRTVCARRITAWTSGLASIGLDVDRKDDATNEFHRADKVRREAAAWLAGAERLARANQLLEQLRARGRGTLPLAAAKLHQQLPELERQFGLQGPGADWSARLDDAMAAPRAEWESPPQAPDSLGRARDGFDRLLRWMDVLGAASRYRAEVQSVEESLVELEHDWGSAGPVGPDRLLDRVESTLRSVEEEARGLRQAQTERLADDIQLVRDARLDVGALGTTVQQLSALTIASAEHHEHWARVHDDGRRAVNRVLSGAAATGDLRQYVATASATAREGIARLRAGILTDAVSRGLAELERDLLNAATEQGTVDGWLSALRTVGRAETRLAEATQAQRAAWSELTRRLAALRSDVELLPELTEWTGLTPTLMRLDADACEPTGTEERLDAWMRRLADTERRLEDDARRVDAPVRAQAAQALRLLHDLSEASARMGEPATGQLPSDLPVEWREWPAFHTRLARDQERERRRFDAGFTRRRAEAIELEVALHARLAAVLPLEDRERVERVLATVGEALSRPEEAFRGLGGVDALLAIVREARDLLDQLSQEERRLEGWHHELEERLDALRADGFRDWNPEIAHRASALLKGIGPRPPVPWAELEVQLQAAHVVLGRLEAEGRRRAGAEVSEHASILRREVQRTGDPAISRLVQELERSEANQLPSRALRFKLRDTVRRLRP